MKQSQYVVHNRGLSQILFSTPWSVRSIFKHVLVIGYIALITVIAFDFNAFKDAMEGVSGGSSSSVILNTAKTFAPHLVWDVLLIFLEIRLLRRTLKMLQTSNRNMWVFIPMSLLTLGLAIFVAVFLPGWMETRLSATNGFINGFKSLSVFVFIYMSVPGITILWSVINAINERRISPFVARANILTSFNMVLWLAALACGTKLSNILFLNKNTVAFDYHNSLQLFLMIAGSILLIATMITSIWTQMDMRKKTNYKFFNKNIEQAIAVAMIIPLTIWLCSTFISMRGNWMEYLFIVLIVVTVIGCVAYAFIRKTEMGSPRVFMVVTSLVLTIIWMLKFFFEYFWDYRVSAAFTLPIALIATSIVMSIIYWKSPMTSKLMQFVSARFIKTLWLMVVVSWVFALIPEDILKVVFAFAPEITESINLILMALPILLLLLTTVYWYLTQWKIKSHINYKAKKHKKKEKERLENIKEARNA